VDVLPVWTVWGDPDRKAVESRPGEGHVRKHLDRLPVDRLAVGHRVGECQEAVIDKWNLDHDQSDDGKHCDRAQPPAGALRAQHEDAGQDRRREIRSPGKGNDKRGKDERERGTCDPSLPGSRAKKHEAERESERRLEIHRIRIRARVEEGWSGAQVEVVVPDRDQKGSNLADRHRAGSSSGDEEESRDVATGPEKVDGDIETGDRFEKVGAVGAESFDVIGSVHDADDARDEDQRDRDVKRGPRLGQPPLRPKRDQISRHRDQDQRLQQRCRQRPVAPANYIERESRGREAQRPQSDASRVELDGLDGSSLRYGTTHTEWRASH